MTDTPGVTVAVEPTEETPKPHELDHEHRLTQLETGKADREHTHEDYALREHEHPEYARTEHEHPEYARVDQVAGQVQEAVTEAVPVQAEETEPQEVEIVEDAPVETEGEPEHETIRVRRHGRWHTRQV